MLHAKNKVFKPAGMWTTEHFAPKKEHHTLSLQDQEISTLNPQSLRPKGPNTGWNGTLVGLSSVSLTSSTASGERVDGLRLIGLGSERKAFEPTKPLMDPLLQWSENSLGLSLNPFLQKDCIGTML